MYSKKDIYTGDPYALKRFVSCAYGNTKKTVVENANKGNFVPLSEYFLGRYKPCCNWDTYKYIILWEK